MAFKQALNATITALAIAAASPQALTAEQAVTPPSTTHPLLSTEARPLGLVNVSIAVREASKDPLAGDLAGNFHVKLEAKLREQRDGSKTVFAPDNALVGQLSIVGVIPPTGLDEVPIGICVQKGVPNAKGEVEHTVLGTFQLMVDGKVVPQVWSGSKVGSTDPATGKFNAACAPFRSAYIEFINRASRPAQNPPAPSSADKAGGTK